MIFYVILASIAVVIIVVTILVGQKTEIKRDLKTHSKKAKAVGNRLKLLEIASTDLSHATARLYGSINSLNEEMAHFRHAATLALQKEPDFTLLRQIVEKRELPLAHTMNSSSQIYENLQVLLAVWNGRLTHTEAAFDLHAMVRRIIADFNRDAARGKPGVGFHFPDDNPVVCVADRKHVARCVRTIIAQAVKQTNEGMIDISVRATEPTLRDRREIVILVEDKSQRIEAGERYEILPDRVGSNPHLKDDPSAVLQLNIARHLASKMGGGLYFDTFDNGNVCFRFCFMASTPSN